MSGMFITFEGVDGCGKTTQLHKAAEWLQSKGHDVLTTREPGGSDIGLQIRKILLNPEHQHLHQQSELLLYLADRLQHLHHVIIPAVQSGKVVLCDRFHDATVAYQGYGRQIDLDPLQPLIQAWIQPHFPTHTLWFQISPTQALKRIQQRASEVQMEEESRLDQESIDFFERVHQGYVSLAAQEPQRFLEVDASGSIDEVFTLVQGQLSTVL